MVSTEKENLQEAFCYELCDYPPTLFEKRNVLLKENMPVLANAIWDKVGSVSEGGKKHIDHEKPTYVFDGGALLHKIPWDVGKTYSAICQSYVSHLRRYGKPVIVFDGYKSGPAPKAGMQTWHTATMSAQSVQFNENMSQ